MTVDYRGFHSPWNKKASNSKMNDDQWKWHSPHVWTLKKQAKYVKDEVEKHRRCIQSATHRNAYWLTHAKPVILERDLFRWCCETYKQRKGTYSEAQKSQRYPTEAEIAAKKQELASAWHDSQATVPTRCIRRQKAMHQAIVLKCEELLDKMAETGELPAAARRAGAAVTNFPVEDIFQMMRRLHERCSVTRIGYLEAMRRVRKAPALGGSVDDPSPFTLQDPPAWYAPWLKKSLRERARHRIRSEWPSAHKRAELRWERTTELTEAKKRKRQALDDKVEEKEEDVLELMGGFVLSGEEREQLTAGALLDLEIFASIDFANEPSWTIPRIANQLKLRNLRKAQRSATLTRLLTEASDEEDAPTLLGRAANFIVSGTRGALIQRLEVVVKIEERALRREEEDRRLDAADDRQAAHDSRRRRTVRLPSHLRSGEFA